MPEKFTPRSIAAPTTFAGHLFFKARMLGDLQFKTIYRDLRATLPAFRGEVLDVGCGRGPYRHLLDAQATHYVGLDIADAANFGFAEPDVVHFDGEHIPFPDNRFDHAICTEVIEHARAPDALVSDIFRVLKPGATAVVTLPWSARYHYIPHDYQRFTPAKLSMLFAAFSEVRIAPRGTDVTAIASKLVVIAIRAVTPPTLPRLLLGIPFLIAFSPFLAIALVFGHASTWFRLGADDDPIGYTIWLKK
jgi:SAM-dependent methyltransferase